MATAWEILSGNSSLPSGTAWEHLNNQLGGGGATVYILEDFTVDVAHENVDVQVSVIDDISLNVTETMVSIDLDEDRPEIVVSDDDLINIEV